MKNEKQKEIIPICIKCVHYAFWDGDDTCVESLKILKEFPVTCRKFSQIECEKLLNFKIGAYLKRKDEKEKRGTEE